MDRVVAPIGPSVGRIEHALVARGLPAGAARMTVGHPGERTAAEIEKLVADLAD
ncbi:hypothetical protein ACIHCV_22800 [Streptomyces sp. NPDC051956]|uniref:hypothetical protein n=1 Tax=Streptomyces sp. NPDC051956 TaxID=3365677 RepID=UPI0037CE2522